MNRRQVAPIGLPAGCGTTVLAQKLIAASALGGTIRSARGLMVIHQDRINVHRPLILLSLAAAASGCIAKTDTNSTAADNRQSTAAAAPRAAAVAQPSVQSLAGEIDLINRADPDSAGATQTPSVAGAKDQAPNPLAIRAQAMLARARFSPGVADGQFGTNFKHALTAYQKARGVPGSGTIDSQTWKMLSAEPASQPPVARVYAITPADIAGPFAADVGEDFVKLAALPIGPQFTTIVEALAERFHMSQGLLRALNPQANFSAAGTNLIVVDDAAPAFARGDVARVDVSKSNASVRAFDRSDKLVAFYPATVGSTERPSPSGTHKVVGVANNPTYTYDPARLAWGPRSAGKLVIKPGPNNPVGAVWIDLNAPSYGIHGTPDPDKIGKTASHGCVRLTNWDAQALAAGVKPGVVVKFIGNRAS
jgi:lipoprotein-anchoring transpeptidase ErfK/SrfK